MAWAQPYANDVQHIECLSRATCHATCHVVRRDSSAIKFERIEIVFILDLFYCLNHYTDEGGEETGVPKENPWQQALEVQTAESFSVWPHMKLLKQIHS